MNQPINIHLENVNLSNNGGPNSFAQKLVKYLTLQGHSFDVNKAADFQLCFIESQKKSSNAPLFQRLDSIYFNTDFDFNAQNQNIKRTYEMADGVVFQSEFGKRLVTGFFGEHPNSIVIHNGADLEKIRSVNPIQHTVLDRYENVWTCAANWRPHKRLEENIRFFQGSRGENDCLVVAGKVERPIKADNIYYVGDVSIDTLISLYKRSKYFVHLAWLDCCPNVVVDARACGCHIFCADSGGSGEVAGENATILKDADWDFRPMKLYDPPRISYEKALNKNIPSEYDMELVAKKYIDFMKGSL